ncbi:MAG: hypothetical protein M1831_007573 [Alyxoria varia]|nr:MAG: hypothetical protein M1831_007573 [Alyxoria varia]
MLRRPPTTLTITRSDLNNHDRTRAQRLARKQEMEESQTFASRPPIFPTHPQHPELDEANDDAAEEVPTEVDEDDDDDDDEDENAAGGGAERAGQRRRIGDEDGGDVDMLDADAYVNEERNPRVLDAGSVTARMGARGMRGERAGTRGGGPGAQDVADGVAAADVNANANVGMTEAERRRARIMGGMASYGATTASRGGAGGRGGGATGSATGNGGAGRRGR